MQKDLEKQPLNNTNTNETVDPAFNQSNLELLKQQQPNASLADEKLEETKKHDYANGCTYDGAWRANRRHGQGTFKWPSGTTYTGEFRNDRRHGHGKIIYADGTKYTGEWRND